LKNLKAAGFSNEQAEAVTEVVRDAQNIDLSNLATKTDLIPVALIAGRVVDKGYWYHNPHRLQPLACHENKAALPLNQARSQIQSIWP
jgi:hypothetical protein